MPGAPPKSAAASSAGSAPRSKNAANSSTQATLDTDTAPEAAATPAAKGDQGTWIRDAFRYMQDPKYPRLKAAVFWHDRWENSADPDHPEFAVNAGKFSDLRGNSSPGSLKASQESVAPPSSSPRPSGCRRPRSAQSGSLQRMVA